MCGSGLGHRDQGVGVWIRFIIGVRVWGSGLDHGEQGVGVWIR